MTLDAIIHQPVRLRVMAALVTLEAGAQLDFTTLRDVLQLTDGNLGAHLRKLDDAGYVRLDKAFVERKPHTYVAATDAGRRAFVGHVAALAEVLSAPPLPAAGEGGPPAAGR